MKVESKSLRIGNFIGCDGNILIVEKIDILNNIGYSLFEKSKGQHVNSGNKYYIPLTEEWLINFGNTEINPLGLGIEVFERFIFIWKESYNYWYVVTKESNEYLTKIEFIHEYQNFIFALTQTELTLNQPQ